MRRLLQNATDALGIGGSALIAGAPEPALAVLVDRLETRSGIETLVLSSTLGQAGAKVRRIKELLEGLQIDNGSARIGNIRRRLDTCCRLRFATALEVARRRRRCTPNPDTALVKLEHMAMENEALSLIDRVRKRLWPLLEPASLTP
jgi:hypothetical protein